MRRFTLLFASFVIFAIASASVQKNLRYLADEERELVNGSGGSDEPNESSPATTPEVTTTPSQGGDESSSSSSSSSSSDTEATTSQSEATTSETEATTSASDGSVSTNPEPSTDPVIPDGEFGCYFAKGKFPTLKDGKFTFTKVVCNIPAKADGDASTPETTTTPASAGGRVLEDGPVVKYGEKKSTCVEVVEAKETLYTCTFTDAPEVDGVTVKLVSDWHPNNETEIGLGCEIAGNRTAVGGTSTGTCPADIFEKAEPFSGKCQVEAKGDKQVFKYDFIDDEEGYTGCNCTAEWNNGNSKSYPTGDNRKIYDTYSDFQPCKDASKKVEIECTVTGWKAVGNGMDGCQWNDGAIASTVSSVLLALAVVFSIVF